MNRAGWVISGGCVVLAAVLSGCAEVGVAGDVATGAGGAVSELATLGKITAYNEVPWRDVVAAVERAAAELKLTMVRQVEHPEQKKLVYKDDRKDQITVTVVRHTDSMTEVHVDVGLFGNEGEGRLMTAAITRQVHARQGWQAGEQDRGTAASQPETRPLSVLEK